jgi:hypothetical protein
LDAVLEFVAIGNLAVAIGDGDRMEGNGLYYEDNRHLPFHYNIYFGKVQ